MFVTEGILLPDGATPDWAAARAEIARSVDDDVLDLGRQARLDALEPDDVREELERAIATVEEAIRDGWVTMGDYSLRGGRFYFSAGLSWGGSPNENDEVDLYRCFEILNHTGLAGRAGFE
ncbi:MAG TPA: hypothetical protein VMT59_15935 [Gaiellaceae bacterium]|nr:hypothetical protein [Gaiellaceae bacterium]